MSNIVPTFPIGDRVHKKLLCDDLLSPLPYTKINNKESIFTNTIYEMT